VTLLHIGFLDIGVWDVIDIALVTILFYYLMMLLRGTRATQMVFGIVALACVYLVASWIRLNAIVWLISLIWKVGVIALVIVFQPELRGALAKIGTAGVSGFTGRKRKSLYTVEEVTRAAVELSRKGLGALMAIEQEVGLRNYIETGKSLSCRVNAEVLISLFYTNAPLHDGAVIIRMETIVAAGCAFPLTQDTAYDHLIGMRHRAAVGLSSETDAVVIVVSEETGSISIAYNGDLNTNIPKERLQIVLESMLKG